MRERGSDHSLYYIAVCMCVHACVLGIVILLVDIGRGECLVGVVWSYSLTAACQQWDMSPSSCQIYLRWAPEASKLANLFFIIIVPGCLKYLACPPTPSSPLPAQY